MRRQIQMNNNKNLSSQIYDEIKKRIVNLSFPPESILYERDLVEMLGVSRTPIREASIKLIQENWLTTSDRRSLKVKEISAKTVKEIFQFREMMESFALRYAFESQTKRVLAGKLDMAVNAMVGTTNDPLEFIKADLAYHTIMIENISNELILNTWLSSCDEITRIAIFSMDKRRRAEDIISEHKYIIEALWSGELELVLTTLKKHHNNILHGCERCFEN